MFCIALTIQYNSEICSSPTGFKFPRVGHWSCTNEMTILFVLLCRFNGMNTKVLLAVVVIAFAVCMVTAKSRASFHSYDKVSFFQYLFFLDERVCFQVGNEWWDFK